MSSITIESLGLTKDELADRLVTRLAADLLSAWAVDDDGEQRSIGKSTFGAMLETKVMERVDAAVADIAGRNVLPNVAQYVETLCLQETNKWGEKLGKPITFTEYLVRRAEAYLTEEVNYEGKPKGQDSFGWRGAQSRITHLVNKHLHYEIETAMKSALAVANSAIATGIQETVRLKLAEIVAGLKLKIETK